MATKKTQSKQVNLSSDARYAVEVLQEHLERMLNKRGVKRYDEILMARGFFNGLCAMAQLNHMNLSERDAAAVFKTLTPYIHKLADIKHEELS
jgi:predicted component of type VI protein secretion system